MELRIRHHSFPFISSLKFPITKLEFVTLENAELVYISHCNTFTNTQTFEIVQYIHAIDKLGAVQNRNFNSPK